MKVIAFRLYIYRNIAESGVKHHKPNHNPPVKWEI